MFQFIPQIRYGLDCMNIVIFGSSGHAKVMIEVIQNSGEHRLLGLIVEPDSREKEVNSVPVIGSDGDLPALSREMGFKHGIIGVYDNFVRCAIKDRIIGLLPDFGFVTAIDPRASISRSAQIGVGTAVMGGVTINAGCVIGEQCVVNTNSSVDHDCVLSNGSSIGPGVTLGGNVKIGKLSYVGIGSVISHNVVVGEHTVIGGSSFVKKDVGDRELGYSSPYRKVRNREPGEKYL